MGPVGVQEMVVIFLVALVLFGPKKLPELGRTIGKALTEFRRAQSELKSTFESHMRELEREADSFKEVARTADRQIQQSYYQEPAFNDPSYYGAAHEAEPSIAVNPSTTGASELPGAEAAPEHELAASGTVPRGALNPPAEVVSNGHPAQEPHA